MNLKLIRSASVYRIALPTLEALEEHLATRPFTPPNPGDVYSAGFVPGPIISEGELATAILGGVAFTLRLDEKVVPGGVVLSELKKRIETIESEQGYRVGRKQKQEIKEAVLVDLYAKALIRTTYTTAFYHRASGYLIVPTTSKRITSLVTNLLVEAVGSIESRTIHISELKNGLTTRLEAYLNGEDEAYAPFELSSSVWLVGPSGEKVTYQLADDLAKGRAGLADALAQGFKVDTIELAAESCTFKLTKDFRFKGVVFPEISNIRDYDTHIDAFQHEANVQVFAFASAVRDLCALFGYKEEAAPVEEAFA